LIAKIIRFLVKCTINPIDLVPYDFSNFYFNIKQMLNVKKKVRK